MRVAVALSGGADSVALLCALTARRAELGLVLHAAHLHHGLRGAEADSDLEFCRALAAKLGLPFHEARVATASEAEADAKTGKDAESIEEAARRLRYVWFGRLTGEVPLDAVATGHTLDDQAETVLAKFLRGAWTEGLGGISPKLETVGAGTGAIVRPMLGVTRAEVEAYLGELGQEWREDSTNRHLTYTRNRIRHQLLPLLESWNPQLRRHLAQMAELARGEEAWWSTELARLTPQIVLAGRPVRGGGRSTGGTETPCVALDVTRFKPLATALQRRVLRYAAEELGRAIDFPATESLRQLALAGRAGQRLDLGDGLQAERSPRELRLQAGKRPGEGANLKQSPAGGKTAPEAPEYSGTVPGLIDAPWYGLCLRIRWTAPPEAGAGQRFGAGEMPRVAIVRNWKPGDRVRLRCSRRAQKVKEVLARLRITGTERATWPVLEMDGRILWMKGVELEPERGLEIKET